MTQKKFNFIRPTTRVHFKQLINLKAFLMGCVGYLIFNLFSFIGGVVIFIHLYKFKYDLTEKWILIEELVQRHHQRYPKEGKEFEESEDELDPVVLHGEYKDLATALDSVGLAELRVIGITQSQMLRWPRLLQDLNIKNKLRYNRFRYYKEGGVLDLKISLVDFPGMKRPAECWQAKTVLRLVFVRRKRKRK